MKKVIIKTALITVCGVFAFIAILYGALALFSPKALIKFWDGVGAENFAKRYSERQYEKTEEISDLYDLILRLDTSTEAEKTVNQIEKILKNENLDAFCAELDVEGKITTKQYLSVKYVYALIELDEFQKALDFSVDFVNENGYTKYNPLRTMFNDLFIKLDQEYKEKTAVAVVSARQNLTDAEQIQLINKDIIDKA